MFVYGAVMSTAERDEVVGVGEIAVDPVFQVMGVAPAMGPLTTPVSAVTVADDQRLTSRSGNGAGGSTDIEDL